MWLPIVYPDQRTKDFFDLNDFTLYLLSRTPVF